MIDALIQPVQSRILGYPAAILSRRGISATAITLTGFALGVLAVPMLALGQYGAALALLLANRIADGLDGAVARVTGPTDRGAFLDIALDFVFYALFPLGFALADPARNALPAAVLIAAFVGTGSSFLAYAAVAGRGATPAKGFAAKGIHYIGGLTEGAETIVLFVAMCLWPGAFPGLAYLFAAACALTTLSRWYQGWAAFTSTPAATNPDNNRP